MLLNCFSSCYAAVMIKTSFPIGQGIHYFERDFTNHYNAEQCTFSDQPCQGIVQVLVVPPKTLYPFLYETGEKIDH